MALQLQIRHGWLNFKWGGHKEEFPSAQEAIDWAEENNIQVTPADRASLYESEDSMMDSCINYKNPDLEVDQIRSIRKQIKNNRSTETTP